MTLLLEVLTKRNGREVTEYLTGELVRQGLTVVGGRASGYLYVPGTAPIMLVAHMDTVHCDPPGVIFHDPKAGVIWSPDGLGADDRAGCFAILEVLRTGRRPYVLFTDGEERGAYGALSASKEIDLPASVRCLVELDRQGAGDAVYYGCGNKAIRTWVRKFGFKEAGGSFSDIDVLCPAWDIAGVNLSVGYYRQHTNAEYLRLNELQHTIDRVCKMVDTPPTERLSYDPIVRHPWVYDSGWRQREEACPRCGAEGKVKRTGLGLYWCRVCDHIYSLVDYPPGMRSRLEE